VEYVARHKGAKHMHSAGQDLSFLEYHNLDILLAIIAVKLFFFMLIKRCCCGSAKKLSVGDSRAGKEKFN
jgi:UDP-glucoronosyl and UDP-glucosyl transferase